MSVLRMVATANELTTDYGTVRFASAMHDEAWHLIPVAHYGPHTLCGERVSLSTLPVPLAHAAAVPGAPICEDCVTVARRRALAVAR